LGLADLVKYPRMVLTNGYRKKNVSGDDIISVLTFAEEPTKTILEGGFRVLFGVEWTQWDMASNDIKKKLLNKGM
jgi:hypothetical protein